MRTRRGGYTLAEVLVVMVLISILTRLAIPAYERFSDRARAARALAELDVIRVAAYTYHAKTNEWPPDVTRGIVPPELVTYLPDGFSFTRGGYVLDWDNWMLPDGSPKHPETNVLLGVSIATEDASLGEALLNVAGPAATQFTIEDHYTFIIAAQ